MLRLVLALLVASPLTALPQETRSAGAEATPVGPAAPLREGVYVGAGLGTSALSSPADALVAYRFRVGMTRSPRLQLGLELHRAEDGRSEYRFTDVSATFFPWRNVFFFRGGLGFSSIFRTSYVNVGFPSSMPVTSGGDGINLLGGLGAQLGRPNGFNLTVNVEAQAHRIKGLQSDQHEHEATLSGWLGLEWH